jgi:hypothetical protein
MPGLQKRKGDWRANCVFLESRGFEAAAVGWKTGGKRKRRSSKAKRFPEIGSGFCEIISTRARLLVVEIIESPLSGLSACLHITHHNTDTRGAEEKKKNRGYLPTYLFFEIF